MPIALPANNRVAVLRADKFHDCIALQVEGEVGVELTGEGVAISFGEVVLHKKFITLPIQMGKISFVLVDPSQDRDKQIVGIAETDSFDESMPGEIYLLQ